MPTNNCQGLQKLQIYFAAPLFSQAEQEFNLQVTESLEKFASVYLPQRDGGLMSDMINKGVQYNVAANHVFQLDINAIRQADCVIAVLDGRTIDEGVSFELGVAFSHNKLCIGLQTDSRRLAVWGNNPMITGALKIVCTTLDDLIENVRKVEPFNRRTSLNYQYSETAYTTML